jgi:hypothetical protein
MDYKNKAAFRDAFGVQLVMDSFGEARYGSTPKLTTAILLLCTAGSIGCTFLTLLDGAFLSSWGRSVEVAARVSPLVFLCASALVFFRPRFGYTLGVIAGLIALPWFFQTEFSPATWNSWISLNYESPIPIPSEVGPYLAFTRLKILSVILIVVAVACSSIRLLPARWSLWKSPLCRCTWPAFAVGFLVLAVWFGYSVTPYSIPAYDHPGSVEFRILHVEKRGLRFHETAMSEERNGRAWILRTERRLFQYRFEERIAWTALAEASPATIERVRTFVQSPTLWELRTPPPRTLRSWNAEGWYVVLKDSRLLAFTSEYGTAPPKEVTELFHQIENLPLREGSPLAVRDVCLGFCYDPLAALGFGVLPQRIRLLSRSAAASTSGF